MLSQSLAHVEFARLLVAGLHTTREALASQAQTLGAVSNPLAAMTVPMKPARASSTHFDPEQSLAEFARNLADDLKAAAHQIKLAHPYGRCQGRRPCLHRQLSVSWKTPISLVLQRQQKVRLKQR